MKHQPKKTATFAWFHGIAALLLLAAASVFYYARYTEPNLLRLQNVSIDAASVTPDLDGIRIVQISDIHLGRFYSPDKLQSLVTRINGLKPDMIVFTGDLIDNFANDPVSGSIAPILSQMNAPLGKFAVYGNHDQGGGAKRPYARIMAYSGFKLLVNEHQTLSIGRSKLVVAGVDDFLLGSPDLTKTLSGIDRNAFVLLLAHEPDVADRLGKYPVDLQLSGHSHGGQVQLPGYGPLYTPPLARKYTEGLYTFHADSRRPLQLYVNRGIGTTRLPFRLDSVPECTIITLKQPASP